MKNTKTPLSNLHITHVPIKELNPAKYNPRTWSQHEIDQLTTSIKKFGLVDPILVNGAEKRKNIVIGGHFRLKIAKDLKYEEVPVVYLSIEEEEREQELNIRLNKNTGSWDYGLLKELDLELLLETGFDESILNEEWSLNENLEEDNFDIKQEYEKIKDPITKTGDIIELGRHKLICGDSTDPKVLNKLLGEIKLDMIYSDPPYNLNYNYQKGLGKDNKYGCGTVKDDRTYSEYQNFLELTLKSAMKHVKKDCHIFYWCDQNYIGLLQNLYKKHGITNKRVCLWIKNNQNVTPQVAFNKCYEPCVYGSIGKPFLNKKQTAFTEILNPDIENGNQSIEDILDLLDIWLVKRLPTSEYSHPTEKPIRLHERPLKRCTKQKSKVLDLFGGSGSTLMACEQLGRTAYLVEKDPVFCDVIRKRYESYNNNKIKIPTSIADTNPINDELER